MKLSQFKNQFKTTKKFLSNLPRKLVTAPLFAFLIISALFLLIGILIFYQKVIIVKDLEIEPTQNIVYFKEEIYQNILDTWAEREQRFKEADSKKYLDIFRNRID
ncbi:hypothetical protein KKA72_02445 [Patescibacteria group bacterium]|nr:hypothetical protein [Patescibacteria group bacterium]MBU1877177.1 hypothetical protein [Patescibacteria group bacterium]